MATSYKFGPFRLDSGSEGARVVASRRLDWIAASIGKAASLSSMKSPSWALARQVVVLLDGAAAVMLIHRDVAYVEAAGELAGKLVQAASR